MMALDTASEAEGGPLFRLNNLRTTSIPRRVANEPRAVHGSYRE